jgi:Stigma-specific protein, Stig1
MTRMSLHTLVGGLLVLILANMGAACGSDGGGGASTLPACAGSSDDVAVVFAERCNTAGCHNAVDVAGGLDLESTDLALRLVDQAAATCDRTLVVPTDTGLSFLYEKVVAQSPECGSAMPIGASLGADEVACIGAWIESLPAGCETCGGSGCADLVVDPSNCGSCGTTCPTGATCAGGTCSCGGIQEPCDGACVDTQSDPSHCGACGNGCPPVQVCSLGDCKMGCDGGLTQCGSACVDTDTDPNNCGMCGENCGAGLCEAGACNCGQGIDIQTDPYNCGSCGNLCAPGQACQAGACTCAATSVSFSATILPIFDARCANIGCHRPPMAKEGLDLSAATAHGALVGVAASQCNDGRLRVAPGDPANSYLLDKMLGVDLCSGSKMPKMGMVPNSEIEAITSWICSGAAND